MQKIDTKIFFTRGNLVSQGRIGTNGLPILIRRMYAEMQHTEYWSLGQELKRSIEPEIQEFINSFSQGFNDQVLRTIYICTTGEGYGEIVSIEETQEVFFNIVAFCYLYRRIAEVGWKPNFDKFSVLNNTNKVFGNIRLKDFRNRTLEDVNEMIDRELY